jgi:hypothetical protein
MRGTSRLAEDLLASQEGLYSMELVGWLVGVGEDSDHNITSQKT